MKTKSKSKSKSKSKHSKKDLKMKENDDKIRQHSKLAGIPRFDNTSMGNMNIDARLISSRVTNIPSFDNDNPFASPTKK